MEHTCLLDGVTPYMTESILISSPRTIQTCPELCQAEPCRAQHLHDPEKATEFARALGLSVGGAGHTFVGNWQTKGFYAYRSGKYSGIAYFGSGVLRMNVSHLHPRARSTALGIAMTPKYQKIFDKN